MVEIVIMAFLGLILFAIIQIAWNAIIYKQKNTFEMVKLSKLPLKYPKNKWINFGLVTTFFTLLFGFIAINIPFFLGLPVIKQVVHFVDGLWLMFTGYLAPIRWGIVGWFVFIPFLAFVFFSIRGFLRFTKTKKNYFKELAEREAKEKEKLESALMKSEADDKQSDDEKLETESPKPVTQPNEPTVNRFVTEPVSLIKYANPLGVMKAYNESKTKGLQLGETENGYVAIYASEEGLTRLKQLFSKYSIDITTLTLSSAIVFFNEDNVESHDIRDYAKSLNVNRGKS